MGRFEAWQRRASAKWLTLDGTEPQLLASWPSAYAVLSGELPASDSQRLPLRDPTAFVSHGLSPCIEEWEQLLGAIQYSGEVLDWIKHGVDVTQFFQHFKGNFKGRHYDSDYPIRFYQGNSTSCLSNSQLVASTLEERIVNGSLQVLGRIDELPPQDIPICIMPLTLDKAKSRLCHDERYLNLFIKDMPFRLDTLRDVPRMVEKGSSLINTDEKSGYDHVSLTLDSRKYFGLMFAGWVFVYTTLPFGFKPACYIYQQIGMCVSVFFRQFGLAVLQYIDDRLFNLSTGPLLCDMNAKLYAVLKLLTSLGFTLSINKSVLVPTTALIFLGFWIDTEAGSFRLPEHKRLSFANLRESILTGETVDLLSLQRLAGKCSSMSIAVPGALFYIRDMNRAISRAQKTSKPVPLTGDLRDEIEHWRFLDNWHGSAVWRKESHSQIKIATDASAYKWAGKILEGMTDSMEIHDYFVDLSAPIHIKEAQAVLKTIEAFGETLRNSRIDILADNQALVWSWNGQGSRSSALNSILKSIFEMTLLYNIDLNLAYIHTSENPADDPSRRLSHQDAMLSADCWDLVEEKFGPHSCDLMSLDSNAMCNSQGMLRHFTPYPTPQSSGVNVFAQKVEQEKNPYVFPPIGLIHPLLTFFRERRLHICTVILPVEQMKPSWWPIIKSRAHDKCFLGEKGETGKLSYPSKSGWRSDSTGLPWDLEAFRMSFDH
jgi:hypothetical protein